jgi:hypothetical protein
MTIEHTTTITCDKCHRFEKSEYDRNCPDGLPDRWASVYMQENETSNSEWSFVLCDRCKDQVLDAVGEPK